MLKLHSLENTELSEYCLGILEKHGIILIREFLREKDETLVKLLNIKLEQLKQIKKKFRSLYGPKQSFIDLDAILKEGLPKIKIYGSQINSLDIMLAPGLLLNEFSFWEICGQVGVGKTQLALTLLLNFVTAQAAPALYIDTKLDFSASRVKNMLKARKIEPELQAGILSFIKVERVLSAQGVVDMLEEFYKQIQQGNEDVRSIKMIVIDSLPAVWFLLKAKSNRLPGKYLLSRLSQNINRLSQKHNIAVICINLSLLPSQEKTETKSKICSTSHNDNDISDLIEADDMNFDIAKSSNLASCYRPVLGHCWLTKPHLRLSLEFPNPEDVGYKNDSSLRIVKLLKSTWHPTNLSCMVRLQPEGVV